MVTTTVPDAVHRRLQLDWGTPSTRSNSLLTDICLGHVWQLDGWLPAAVYVRLLDDLGVVEATARSGLHRMAKGGFLTRETRAGVRGYALSRDWIDYIGSVDTQHHRMLYQEPQPVEAGWTMLCFTIPETQRATRHVLRSVLARAGFGTVSPGLWIVPGNRAIEIQALVQQLGYSDFVSIFTARHHGPHGVREFAAQCWDLDALSRDFESVLARHAPSARRTRDVVVDPREAFVVLTLAYNDFRQAVRRDPLLPAGVLPDGWAGEKARAVIRELFERLRAPARAYVSGLVSESGRPCLARSD